VAVLTHLAFAIALILLTVTVHASFTAALLTGIPSPAVIDGLPGTRFCA